MVTHLDVCIRGGGVVGRTLALLLARERLRVGLVEQATSPGAGDVRAYALNRASRELLESVRGWPEDDTQATPVRRMEVWGDQGGHLSFDAQSLDADALTWIVDVPALEQRLAEAVRYQPQIEHLALPAPATLTVVCEGRDSRTRAEFGVEFQVLPYGQHALATRVLATHAHGGVARQWFGPDGEILAFLPLEGPAGHTVAVVWSVAPARATALQALPEADFCLALQQASHDTLGTLTLAGERRAWALQRARARQWTGTNAVGAWALAGDAAHNVHPLAGQGLNLGLADVAELARVLREREYWRRIGDPRLLRRYERARKAGLLALDTGMDGLQRLFARGGEPWGALRNWGMKGVEASHGLKHWLARRAMSF